MNAGRGKEAGRAAGRCDTCAYYMYDEDYEEYVCDADMDEDDYGRLMSEGFRACPCYRDGDEYKVVRGQM